MVADIVLILIMALCTFLGYKRGLIKVAVRILSFFVALIIALVLYNPISNYVIENTELANNIENVIRDKLYNQNQVSEDGQQSNNIPEMMEKYMNDYTDEVKENSAEYVAKEGAVIVVRIGTWIGLFLITKILMIFVRFFADVIGNLPIVKQFNKAGGTIYGVLEGFILIYVFLAVFSMIQPMIGENEVSKLIESSFICKMMYENNLILNIIL